MEKEIEHLKDIKEDIKILKNKINQWQPYKNVKFSTEIEKEIARENEAIENILNELERLQKEFEAVDNECSRLEQKEIILESENEHYKDLIYALETYYDIKEEDLENCIKEDR